MERLRQDVENLVNLLCQSDTRSRRDENLMRFVSKDELRRKAYAYFEELVTLVNQDYKGLCALIERLSHMVWEEKELEDEYAEAYDYALLLVDTVNRHKEFFGGKATLFESMGLLPFYSYRLVMIEREGVELFCRPFIPHWQIKPNYDVPPPCPRDGKVSLASDNVFYMLHLYKLEDPEWGRRVYDGFDRVATFEGGSTWAEALERVALYQESIAKEYPVEPWTRLRLYVAKRVKNAYEEGTLPAPGVYVSDEPISRKKELKQISDSFFSEVNRLHTEEGLSQEAAMFRLIEEIGGMPSFFRGKDPESLLRNFRRWRNRRRKK